MHLNPCLLTSRAPDPPPSTLPNTPPPTGRGLNGILASELEDDTATTNGNGHHESDQLRPSTDRRRSGAGAKLALHAQQQQQHVAFKEQGKEVAADQEAAGHHKDSDDKWGATWVDQVRPRGAGARGSLHLAVHDSLPTWRPYE